MRFLLAAAVAFGLMTAPAEAQAPPIVTNDPGVYAQVMADAMMLSGVAPVREVFNQMLAPDGGALPTDVEAALLTYERSQMTTPAAVSRVIEDVTLSDALRVVYMYHYFGENVWIFTRLDFVSIGEGRWALTRLAFSDRWSNVVLSTTPGFRPSSQARR